MTSDICQGENSSEPILSSVTSPDVLIPESGEPWPACWGLVSRFTETRIRRDLIRPAGGRDQGTLSPRHWPVIELAKINLQVQLMDCIEMVLSLSRNSHQIWHIPSWSLINFYKTSTSPGAGVSHLWSGNQGNQCILEWEKSPEWEMLISD